MVNMNKMAEIVPALIRTHIQQNKFYGHSPNWRVQDKTKKKKKHLQTELSSNWMWLTLKKLRSEDRVLGADVSSFVQQENMAMTHFG